MTHGWKAMNHTIFLRPKRGGVICCHTAKNNFVITVHWNVGKISDLVICWVINVDVVVDGPGLAGL